MLDPGRLLSQRCLGIYVNPWSHCQSARVPVRVLVHLTRTWDWSHCRTCSRNHLNCHSGFTWNSDLKTASHPGEYKKHKTALLVSGAEDSQLFSLSDFCFFAFLVHRSLWICIWSVYLWAESYWVEWFPSFPFAYVSIQPRGGVKLHLHLDTHVCFPCRPPRPQERSWSAGIVCMHLFTAVDSLLLPFRGCFPAFWFRAASFL